MADIEAAYGAAAFDGEAEPVGAFGDGRGVERHILRVCACVCVRVCVCTAELESTEVLWRTLPLSLSLALLSPLSVRLSLSLSLSVSLTRTWLTARFSPTHGAVAPGSLWGQPPDPWPLAGHAKRGSCCVVCE